MASRSNIDAVIRAAIFCVAAVAISSTAEAQGESVPLPQPRPAVEGSQQATDPEARDVPLPPEKPEVIDVPLPAEKPEIADETDDADPAEPVVAEPPACLAVEEGRIEATPRGAIVDPDGGCDVPASFSMTEAGGIDLAPEAILNCEMAERFDRFVSEVMEPAARETVGSRLVRLSVAGSYVCRPRNNIAGGDPSEHGKANAIDLTTFEFEDGTSVTVSEHWDDEGEAGDFLREIHEKACGPFTTVIGPDGDAYHQDHFHFDNARRGADGRSTWCE